MRIPKPFKRFIMLTLLLTFIVSMAVPFTAYAEEPEQNVVRVGWFDSSFYYLDQSGRRCGIAYEYEHKISAYTGWTYEYVEDSWPNLLQMLKDGEIDLLSDVSFKPDRAEYMSFPELPMGAESYYIYIDAENRDLTAAKPESFNGTRIGVNEGSVQEGFLGVWAEKNNITLEVVPLDLDEDESMDMVTRGEIDGFVSIYSFSSKQKVVPVCRIGSSEYFYAVNKSRPDLLAELNMALAGIQDEDPYFNQRLSDERLYNARTNAFLTPDQEDWIKAHGTIRVGYRDNYLPYCQTDKETNELTGALKDYLAHAENNLRSSDIQFEVVPYASSQEAIEAMKAGEIDCVFPAYLSSYDSDEIGIRLTDPAMRTEMSAIMRTSDIKHLSRDSKLTFAVSSGDPNVQTFILDKYPLCNCETYENDEACCKAVVSGDADCVLVSNYRIPASEDVLTKYRLFAVPVGESMPLSFAVNKAEKDLYFLLNKTVLMTDSDDMDSALASYMQLNHKVSFTEFLKDNWIWVVAILTVLFSIIIITQQRIIRAEREVEESHHQVNDLTRQVFVDELTHVRNKAAYVQWEEKVNESIRKGEQEPFAVVVCDVNNLKLVNDQYGHKEGDICIKNACAKICSIFSHSPVFRVGGDEFVAFLTGVDFYQRKELMEQISAIPEDPLKIRIGETISAGIAEYRKDLHASLLSVFEEADKAMYERKQFLKENVLPKENMTDSNPAYEYIPVIHSRKCILIVDDVEMNREIMGDLLEDEYDILYASDGVEALDVLRNYKDEIDLVLLDLLMPNKTGREVIAEIKVDDDLMSVPVIVLTSDQQAELDCLKIGAMDFIPKPLPDIDIIKARISKCIELSEDRELIRYTERDKLTGLLNKDYFFRYAGRLDHLYKDHVLDAVVCDVDRFHSLNKQYGRQFGDQVLRSIGRSVQQLASKTGGIGCRKDGDIFLLYCPHQLGYEQMFRAFLSEILDGKETADKVHMRFGVFADARQEPDIEERFKLAKIAADKVKNDPETICGFYDVK